MKILTLFMLCLSTSFIYAQVDLSQGLIGYYPLNGNLMDMSGNNNHMDTANYVPPFSPPGNPPPPTPPLYQADKDGITNHALTSYSFYNIEATSATPSIGTGDFTFSAWFKTSSSTNFSTVLISEKAGNDEISLLIQDANTSNSTSDEIIISSSRIAPPFGGFDDRATITNASSIADTSQWHLAVGQREGDSLRIFLYDAIGQRTNTSLFAAQKPNINTNVTRATGEIRTALDDIRVYNRALNLQELDALFTGGVTVVGKVENSNMPVDVFPNPSKDVVNIQLAELNDYTLELFDLRGQRLQTQQLKQANQTQLDLTELAAGHYVLRISSATQYTTKKIVKRK